jgi:hypothetical protein
MASRNQPTYDFLTGPSSASQHGAQQPLTSMSLRQSQQQQHHHHHHQPQTVPSATGNFGASVTKAGVDNEDLRAQIQTLRYEVQSLKEEKELATLRHGQEVREAQGRAEEGFTKIGVCICSAFASLSSPLYDAEGLRRNYINGTPKLINIERNRNWRRSLGTRTQNTTLFCVNCRMFRLRQQMSD